MMKSMKKVAFAEWLSRRRADDRLPRGSFFKGQIGGALAPEKPSYLAVWLEKLAKRPFFPVTIDDYLGNSGVQTIGASPAPRVTVESLARFMVSEDDSSRYERALGAMLKDGYLSDRVHVSEPDSDPQREKDFLALVEDQVWASVATQVKNGMWSVPPLQGKTDIAMRMLAQHCTPETRFFMAEEPFERFPIPLKPSAKEQADD